MGKNLIILLTIYGKCQSFWFRHKHHHRPRENPEGHMTHNHRSGMFGMRHHYHEKNSNGHEKFPGEEMLKPKYGMPDRRGPQFGPHRQPSRYERPSWKHKGQKSRGSKRHYRRSDKGGRPPFDMEEPERRFEKYDSPRGR